MEVLNKLSIFDRFSGFEELSPIFLWGVFFLLIVLAIVLGFVLYYHFITFGFKVFPIKKMAFLYLVICAFLGAMAYVSIQSYLNSL